MAEVRGPGSSLKSCLKCTLASGRIEFACLAGWGRTTRLAGPPAASRPSYGRLYRKRLDVSCSQRRNNNMMSLERLTEEQSATGLQVALRIIGGWKTTSGQACRILRISPSMYRRASKGSDTG